MHGKKRFQGVVYDLTHLDTFTLSVTANVRLKVEFGKHTFTEKFTPLHTKDLAIMDGNELRAFCLNRYGHSKQLPEAVRAAVGGQVYLSDGKPVIATGIAGLDDPYLIAFQIRARPAKRFDGVLIIVSAHARPGFDMTELPSAPFRAVVACALTGAKVDWKKK